MVPSIFAHWWLIAAFALAAALFALRNTYEIGLGTVDGAREDASTVKSDLRERSFLANETVRKNHHVERGLSIGSSANYKSCKTTGRKILCAFDNPSRASATSFTSFSQLDDWGWTQSDLPAFSVSTELEDYADELSAKGFNVESPTMRGIKWVHTKETTHDRKRYPVYPRLLSHHRARD